MDNPGHTRCPAYLIVVLSQTCKWLQQMTDEHQIWLHQVRHLQIPIPPGTTPSKTELKSWAISHTRVDALWIKPAPGDLTLCSFETHADFVEAHLIPGGEFVVLLYNNGDISLIRIERSVVTGKLMVREVAGYRETDEEDYPDHWSGLLTETSYGCPMLVLVRSAHLGEYVATPAALKVLINVDDRSAASPLFFLIDPVSQVIQKKQPIHTDFEDGTYLWNILAIKNRMFFICEDSEDALRITIVAEPGPNSVTKHLNLSLRWVC